MDVTDRGFTVMTFQDRYDHECSIQKSSLATEDCIWLGVNSAKPQIMAVHARKHGIKTQETTGWVPYRIPKDVNLNTRMHLTREQVASLLPLLTSFVNTGDLV